MLFHAKTITQYHAHRGLPPPAHPLLSVAAFEDMHLPSHRPVETLTNDFYLIGLKRQSGVRMRFGRQEFDFDAGLMFFLPPGQAYTIEVEEGAETRGWLLAIHPDFLWNTPLADLPRRYDYFGYSLQEALHLSAAEESVIAGIVRTIGQEYRTPIDAFSQSLVVAQLGVMLTYAERFYHRQFLTRRRAGHEILSRLAEVLERYLHEDHLATHGLPTVQQVARDLYLSPNYLSDLLRVLTGKSTQEHIHQRLINRAKRSLTATDTPVTEIAYQLGFRHPQSFSKLFRARTGTSPSAFRKIITPD